VLTVSLVSTLSFMVAQVVEQHPSLAVAAVADKHQQV
jgi:hypothetical protein